MHTHTHTHACIHTHTATETRLVCVYIYPRTYHIQGAEAKPLPPHYICNRCQTPGHWMKDCPNNDVFITFGGGGGVGVAVARPVHNKLTSWDVPGGGGGSSPPHGGDTPSSMAGPSLSRGGGGRRVNETLFSNSNEPLRTDACLQGIGARVQGPFRTIFGKDGLPQNQQQVKFHKSQLATQFSK